MAGCFAILASYFCNTSSTYLNVDSSFGLSLRTTTVSSKWRWFAIKSSDCIRLHTGKPAFFPMLIMVQCKSPCFIEPGTRTSFPMSLALPGFSCMTLIRVQPTHELQKATPLGMILHRLGYIAHPCSVNGLQNTQTQHS